MKLFPAVMVAFTVLMMSLAMAEPLLPVRRVPDEFRSLADLKSVRLNVAEVPPTLAIHDIETEDIRTLWVKHLRGAGIEVADDSLAPTLKVRLLGGSDPATPDSVAYVFTACPGGARRAARPEARRPHLHRRVRGRGHHQDRREGGDEHREKCGQGVRQGGRGRHGGATSRSGRVIRRPALMQE